MNLFYTQEFQQYSGVLSCSFIRDKVREMFFLHYFWEIIDDFNDVIVKIFGFSHIDFQLAFFCAI